MKADLNTQLVTAKELAEHFRVHLRTVHRWQADGRLPFHRIGPKAIRFDIAAVNRALGIGGGAE